MLSGIRPPQVSSDTPEHSLPMMLNALSKKKAAVKKMGEISRKYQGNKEDINGLYLPGTLEKKYPNIGKEWALRGGFYAE
jgi:hypothetical protein